MSNQLSLEKREATGKKLKALRAEGMIPSVVYGGEMPVMTISNYNETEKVLNEVGFHSPVELSIDGKTQLAIVKDVDRNPVNRRIMNVEFQAVSADRPVEATAPIRILNFDSSEAAKKHYVILQVLEEIDIKARPSDLPEEIVADAAKLAEVDDKLTLADLEMPANVMLVDKELAENTVIANVYDPAAEAAARDAEDQKAEEAATSEATAEETKAE